MTNGNIELKNVWLVLVACGLMIGCADPYRKAEQEGADSESAAPPAATADSAAPNSRTVDGRDDANRDATDPQDDQVRREAVERVYGEIDLKDYSDITIDWIEQNLKPERMASTVGTQSEISVRKPLDSELSYDWTDGGVQRRVRISIPFSGQTESQMMIQVGVMREMVKSDKAEEVDLGVPGVVAILRGPDRSELYLFTSDRAILVGTGMVEGRESNNSEAMKTAAIAIAKTIFDLRNSTRNGAD